MSTLQEIEKRIRVAKEVGSLPLTDEFSQIIRDYLTHFITLDLVEALKAKAEQIKYEAQQKAQMAAYQTPRPIHVTPQIQITPELVNVVKGLDEQTINKLRLLFTPLDPNTSILIALLTMQQQQQSQSRSDVLVEMFKSMVEQQAKYMEQMQRTFTEYMDRLVNIVNHRGGGEAQRGIMQEMISFLDRLVDRLAQRQGGESPEIVALKKDLEVLREKVEKEIVKPHEFLDSLFKIAEKLGWGPKQTSAEEMRIKADIEKFSKEMDLKIKKYELEMKKSLLKLRHELEREKMLMKYVIPAVLGVVQPAVEKRARETGREIGEKMKSSGIQTATAVTIKCVGCGRTFFVQPDEEGRLPDRVRCPFCGMEYVKREVSQEALTTGSTESTHVSQSQAKSEEKAEALAEAKQ